ncbi:kinase [Polymorphobacter sp.]|uniref:kinase n=1 Tax=Polymorphobacter sp. TaxID=1909290 RepID=UPI003F71AE93
MIDPAPWRPLAARIAGWRAGQGRDLLVGLSGVQGSGKSTLAALLVDLLGTDHGLRAVAVSIDDFYLTRAERSRLAATVHPLFLTRGVPGTHDMGLIRQFLASLSLTFGPVRVPRFDKTADDRAPQSAWTAIDAPVDVVIFEGWCLGARPQPAEALALPINALEAQEDADGRWRTAVNDQLAGPYAALWERLDRLLVLQAPSWDVVAGWRAQAETRMNAAELGRFMQHYERISRALLDDPPVADWVARLDAGRRAHPAGG